MNWLAASATGSHYSIPPYEAEYVCSRPLPEPQCPPGDCGGFGNPIFGEDATKRQREVDYAPMASASALRFDRLYRSDLRRFVTNYDDSFEIPQKGPLGRGCLQSVGQLHDGTVISHCFRRVAASNGYLRTLSAAGHWQYYAWNGTAATAVRSHVLDAVGPITLGGPEVWFQRRSKEGDFVVFGSQGELLKVVRLDGYTQELTYSNGSTPPSVAPGAGYLIQIADPWGRSLNLTYGSMGELVALILPDGEQIEYAYEPITGSIRCEGIDCLRLSGVTYADATTRTYHWDEPAATTDSTLTHLLTGITDETATRHSTYRYIGAYAVSTELAGGVSKYEFSSILLRTRLNVKDPNNVVRTFNYANADGLIRLSSISGQPCPECGPKAQTFNAQGLLTSRDDFNGNRTCFAYEPTRRVESARVEGLTIPTTCPALIAPGSTLPAGVRKISTQWHPDWYRPVRLAEPNRITTIVYNGQPDPFNGNAPAACAAGTALLPDGSPIAVVCKRVEQATSDANGAQGFSAPLTGSPRVWTYSYNSDGQLLTEDGPRTDVSDVTTYEYYSATDTAHTPPWYRGGDLKKVTNPAGHEIEFTQYDPHGQVLQAVDSNGVSTVLTYDLRQRLTSLNVSDGTNTRTTSYEYWPTGKLKKVTEPDGSYVSYSYDAAQRLVGVSDSEGNSIAYTLDAMGNRIQEDVSDPGSVLAQRIERSFDALSRLQQLSGAAP